MSKSPRGPGYLARITQVEKALHEAEQAKQALEEQLRQSRKLESLGSLAGGLAHDLNNVLGVILALAARAQRGLEPSGPVSDSLESIVSACDRGREVVGDLLRFVRKEPGTHRPVSVNMVVREVAQWLSPELLKGTRVVLELDESLPMLLGEGGALSHAIMNLCVNALDAMPEGGTLTMRSWLGPKGEVRLGIRDTGAGMTPEVARRAMEAFFTTKPAGTGLGLPLVAATLKAHGGRVELNSQPGVGTAVLLVFPCLPEPIPPRASGRPLRILMVDDDADLRGVLCPLLGSLGHQAQEAPGGLEAIQMFEDGLDVDLVLLDLNMPGLGGAETLLRLLELRPGLPVLMASSREDQELSRFLGSHPTASLISKPFKLDELKARMAALDPSRRRG